MVCLRFITETLLFLHEKQTVSTCRVLFRSVAKKKTPCWIHGIRSVDPDGGGNEMVAYSRSFSTRSVLEPLLCFR